MSAPDIAHNLSMASARAWLDHALDEGEQALSAHTAFEGEFNNLQACLQFDPHSPASRMGFGAVQPLDPADQAKALGELVALTGAEPPKVEGGDYVAAAGLVLSRLGPLRLLQILNVLGPIVSRISGSLFNWLATLLIREGHVLRVATPGAAQWTGVVTTKAGKKALVTIRGTKKFGEFDSFVTTYKGRQIASDLVGGTSDKNRREALQLLLKQLREDLDRF